MMTQPKQLGNVINGILCHMAERFSRVIAGLVEIHHGFT